MGEVASQAPLAGSPGETWLSVPVAHPLLVIFASMWHLGSLPTSDENTCEHTHTHTHYNVNVSVIDTLMIPLASFI